MEKQKLPHSTLVLVLSILSLPLCMCYGIGLVLAIIALILAIISTKTYRQNPDLYEGYSNLNAGKIIAIISILLNLFIIVFSIMIISAIGWDVLQSGDQEAIQDAINEYFGQ